LLIVDFLIVERKPYGGRDLGFSINNQQSKFNNCF